MREFIILIPVGQAVVEGTVVVGGRQWCLLQRLTPFAMQLVLLLGASTGGGAAAVARLHNSGNTFSLQVLQVEHMHNAWE